SEETITLKQDKDIVKVITKTKLLSLELFNTKGQRVNYVEGNEVRLPSKGVFLLTITTEKGKTQKKVINL
ncbi:MAG: T9SS type A sorting domain-containing protein, partial [Bacteroidales bacterium]|nr:T9SS type A sorting domain-containing protein [Bacteroidales bacterium]